MTIRRGVPMLVLSAVLAATGCADDSGDDTSPGSSAPAPAEPASSSPTRAPFQVMDGPLRRCGPQPAAASEAGFRYLRLRDPDVGTVPAIRAGSGRTALVLLHQTDGNGLCGWLEFATLLADDPDLSLLAIDLCKYGASRCTKVADETFAPADQVDAVEMAVRYARETQRARRVVVMGASMGGSVAMMAAAGLPGIDAAVDLSGPVGWSGMEAVREGRALPVPVLVAMADQEGPEEVRGARRIVRNAPKGSELVPAEAGHGYELLVGMDGSPTPIAERVLSWIAAP